MPLSSVWSYAPVCARNHSSCCANRSWNTFKDFHWITSWIIHHPFTTVRTDTILPYFHSKNCEKSWVPRSRPPLGWGGDGGHPDSRCEWWPKIICAQVAHSPPPTFAMLCFPNQLPAYACFSFISLSHTEFSLHLRSRASNIIDATSVQQKVDEVVHTLRQRTSLWKWGLRRDCNT